MRTHLQSSATCAAVLAAVAVIFVEIKAPAAEIDPASAVRGSLGVPIQDLSLSNNLGESELLMNGGFALLTGAAACFAIAGHRRRPTSNHDRPGNSPSSSASGCCTSALRMAK
jgi:hypothetical protein